MTIGRRGGTSILAAVSALALLSACAGAESDSPGTDGNDGDVKVAFLTASAANTWLSASQSAMEDDAAKAGVDLVTFDAKFEPGVAAKQIRDIITSQGYDGIIIATNDGAGVVPAVEDAIDAGLKVVVLNQVIGTKLDTADPQVPGVSASVLAPPFATGERLGKLTVEACADQSPCDVVYMYGLKGSPYDTAVREGFDSQISGDSNISVVAEAEGGFLGTDEPRKATQDIIQAHPDFNVFVGAGDQQIRGALLALGDAGMDDVRTIGVGLSEPALAAIKDGTWWGDVAGVPATEGHLAFEAMMHALDGQDDGGIDATSSLIDDGMVTQANVSKFTAQWTG